MPKIHTMNGFEYYCERYWENVTWHFRPTDRELWATCSLIAMKQTLKADVEKLLATPQEALEYYDQRLALLANLEEAENRLQKCKRAREHYKSDAFDPGGRRNNPGAVRRDLARAADSDNEVTRAEEALKEAKRVRAILEAGNRRKASD